MHTSCHDCIASQRRHNIRCSLRLTTSTCHTHTHTPNIVPTHSHLWHEESAHTGRVRIGRKMMNEFLIAMEPNVLRFHDVFLPAWLETTHLCMAGIPHKYTQTVSNGMCLPRWRWRRDVQTRHECSRCIAMTYPGERCQRGNVCNWGMFTKCRQDGKMWWK